MKMVKNIKSRSLTSCLCTKVCEEFRRTHSHSLKTPKRKMVEEDIRVGFSSTPPYIKCLDKSHHEI